MRTLSRMRVLVVVVMATVAMVLCGCAAVVYKDAAASYVAASKDLTKQLNEVSARLVASEDMQRRQKIVKDPMCPIVQDRIFVRVDASVTFTPLIQRMPGMATAPGCPMVVACERGDKAPECARACYTAAEGNCLKMLEAKYTQADAASAATGADAAARQQIAGDAKTLVKLLHQVEYERGDSITSKLMADNLAVLAQYMDLLEKASTSKDVDFTDDVTRINKRIDSVIKGYTTVTGSQLSSADTATRDNIGKSLGLLGTFGGHLATLQKNAKDAERIKEFVRNNSGVADSLIASIERVVDGDDYLGVVYNDAAVRDARGAVAKRFTAARSEYERGVLLDEALKYRYASATDSQKKLQDVFASLRQSHATLTRLVLNPDDKQLQAIHSEEFQNFRTVAQDVAGIIAQVAKF